MERGYILIHRSAALSGALRNPGDRREQILDAVVEFADEHALLFLGTLAVGDVSGQSREAQTASGRIELRLAGFLKPHRLAVRADEAKRCQIDRVLGAQALDLACEAAAVIWMHACEKILAHPVARRVRFQAETL